MIIRSPRPESQYLVVPNDVLRDERLSYRARGLLVALLSHTDNWRITSEELAKKGLEGRDAIRAALSELEQFRYLVREKVQNDKGRWETNSYIFDRPKEANVDLPTTGKPTTGLPTLDNQALLEVPSRSTIKNKDKDAEILADFFVASLLQNGLSKAKSSQEWVKCFDRMMRLDERTPDQIRGAIKWAHSDDFWAKNILSPQKLRKHYDRLRLQAGGSKAKPKGLTVLEKMRSQESPQRLEIDNAD